MKCIILAGGLGSRLAEETKTKPKPMVKVGGYPILWHIMKIYSSHGIKEFIICTGYKKKYIENYFKPFLIKKSKKILKYFDKKNRWKITCVDTGKETQTAGRLLKLKKILENDKHFCLTYGDGLSDINIRKTINIFEKKNKSALVTVVQPPARYGVLNIKNDLVLSFKEKVDNKEVWINGGFFIMKTEILKLINNYNQSLEYDLLPKIVKKRQLVSFKHEGFWQAMDTLRDKISLQEKWKMNKKFWKVWKK